MNAPKDISAELLYRIQSDIDHFGGTLPEKTAISWRGYLAAMLEWNLIPLDRYEALLARIPQVDDDPAITILRGRD
jgi:hypothetical protein